MTIYSPVFRGQATLAIHEGAWYTGGLDFGGRMNGGPREAWLLTGKRCKLLHASYFADRPASCTSLLGRLQINGYVKMEPESCLKYLCDR